MAEQTLESYMVRLGFSVDQQSFKMLNGTLEGVGKKMSSTVGSLGGDLLKLQFQLTSGLMAIGAASISTMTSFASFDQAMRLGSQTAFMTKENYTKLNEALRMTGVTLAEASWDPESNARLRENMDLVGKLNESLGGNAEEGARKIRDFKNQFEQLGEEVKYLSFAVGNDLFAKLFGGGDAQKGLQKFNEWLLNNLPKLADELSTDLVPIMKDLFVVGKDTFTVFEDGFAIFQEIIGLLSGDSTLQTTKVDFESVAKSVEHTVHWFDDLLKSILKLEGALLTFDFSKLTGGDLAHLGEAGLLTKTGRGLLFKGAGKILGGGGGAAAGTEAAEAGGAIGLGSAIPIAGTAVGGAIALNSATKGTFWDTSASAAPGQGTGIDDQMAWLKEAFGFGEKKTQTVHDRLKANADRIAALTGQKPELVYAQLAHETGNGANRGYQDLHNLSGIKNPGGHGYREFASDEAYDDFMAKLLKKDLGTAPVANIEDYAARLKKGAYFEASQAEYVRGMTAAVGGYGGPASVTNHITVTVAKTDASPQEIASAVKDVLNEQSATASRYGTFSAGGSLQ